MVYLLTKGVEERAVQAAENKSKQLRKFLKADSGKKSKVMGSQSSVEYSVSIFDLLFIVM